MSPRTRTVKEPPKKTLDEVRDIVECEGLGYSIMHYMDADDIADPTLRAAWQTARNALVALETMLEPDYE